jgi:hypothetical protein
LADLDWNEQLETALGLIFSKYAQGRDVSAPIPSTSTTHHHHHQPTVTPKAIDRETLDKLFLKPEGMARFGIDTNGSPLSQEQLEEIGEFLDVTDEGWLTFEGFLQVSSVFDGIGEVVFLFLFSHTMRVC